MTRLLKDLRSWMVTMLKCLEESSDIIGSKGVRANDRTMARVERDYHRNA